ncbi:5860_t:CDS:1 [Racocetra fulgida]|uniref:5860_t:CDS:1 n=1 Tax=Racocetra fulgida TaxID=60492 RepID=A0A9N8ZNJ5_9GLOM|nr:5860_t:CDS:1 [Racocetra fulgida]
MIYLDELSEYPAWILCLIAIGIAALVYGVLLLSEAKSTDEDSSDEDEFDDSKIRKRRKKKKPEPEDVFADCDKWLKTWQSRFSIGEDADRPELQIGESEIKPTIHHKNGSEE